MSEPTERLRLRPATSADAAFVHRVLDEAIGEHARTHGGWDEAANRERVALLLDSADTSVVVVEGEDAGYLAVWRSDEQLYVASIALARRWRGRGLGTILLRELIDEAARRGVPLRLSVLDDSPARRLYERLGFAVTRVEGRKLRMELAPG